jgi:acyl-CoA reductase-like NAD-dependent aldehyde dehydrogenase
MDAIIGERRMLIDGELVDARSGATFDNINPAIEDLLGVVADADAADVDRAIAARRRCSSPMRRCSVCRRTPQNASATLFEPPRSKGVAVLLVEELRSMACKASGNDNLDTKGTADAR